MVQLDIRVMNRDDLLVRQGGLRFHWDWAATIVVRTPDDRLLGELTVGLGQRGSLTEAHEVIDNYCAQRSQS